MIDRATTGQRYRAITRFNVCELPQWRSLDAELREAVETCAMGVPSRVAGKPRRGGQGRRTP